MALVCRRLCSMVGGGCRCWSAVMVWVCFRGSWFVSGSVMDGLGVPASLFDGRRWVPVLVCCDGLGLLPRLTVRLGVSHGWPWCAGVFVRWSAVGAGVGLL